VETERVRMICGTCGSDVVTRDAWAEWNTRRQDWVLGAVYDYAYCHDCQNDTRIEEVPIRKRKTRKPKVD
jgi:hypothetical protein